MTASSSGHEFWSLEILIFKLHKLIIEQCKNNIIFNERENILVFVSYF